MPLFMVDFVFGTVFPLTVFSRTDIGCRYPVKLIINSGFEAVEVCVVQSPVCDRFDRITTVTITRYLHV